MTRILTQQEVRSLLPMEACMDCMRQALSALARNEAVNPLRAMLRLPDGRGLLGWMPGYLGTPQTLGMKVVTVFPGNHGTEYDSHQGVVMLFDLEHGLPLAILDASEITAIRTAAVTGVATELLAREDADDVALLGSGVQARTHLEARRLARPIRRARVYSPTRENREAFARRESERHGIEVSAVDSARDAIEGAGIICAVSSSREPVLEGAWLSPGVHINAVGSSIATARELDSVAVARSRLFVDRLESTVNESGDYLAALREGAISDNHIVGEIGSILTGAIEGRRGDDEITLFKSLGLAVEDLAAAEYAYRRALEQDVGVDVALGGSRHGA